jgi:hypothetical protein
MKTRIEAGDLRDTRQPIKNFLDGGKIVWLM